MRREVGRFVATGGRRGHWDPPRHGRTIPDICREVGRTRSASSSGREPCRPSPSGAPGRRGGATRRSLRPSFEHGVHGSNPTTPLPSWRKSTAAGNVGLAEFEDSLTQNQRLTTPDRDGLDRIADAARAIIVGRGPFRIALEGCLDDTPPGRRSIALPVAGILRGQDEVGTARGIEPVEALRRFGHRQAPQRGWSRGRINPPRAASRRACGAWRRRRDRCSRWRRPRCNAPRRSPCCPCPRRSARGCSSAR